MKKTKNHQADIQNPNAGTSGVNSAYAQNQGNKGKQLNPNNISTAKAKKQKG